MSKICLFVFECVKTDHSLVVSRQKETAGNIIHRKVY